MKSFWEAALTIAGLGAVVSFVFWSLYRGWLKLPIFQQMTKGQQFSLFKLFLWLAFAFAIIGLGAYVLLQLFGPSQRAAENSVGELLKLKRERRTDVLDLIESQNRTFGEERQKALDEGKPTQEIEAKVQRLHAVKERFDRLSTEYLSALEDRQFVRSHELLRDIFSLLDDPQTQALFLQKVIFGNKEEPVFIPTRKLTRLFFGPLPKDLASHLGQALPDPNPFGQKYPDPSPPTDG